MAFISPAAADTQVSSEFTRVAKTLGKRIATDQLKKEVCVDGDGDAKPVCEAIADSVSTAFAMVIDQQVDEAALSTVLVDLATKLTQAATANAARALIRPLLESASSQLVQRVPSCRVQAASMSTDIAGCLISRALPNGTMGAACKKLDATLNALSSSCGAALPLSLSSSSLAVAPGNLVQSLEQVLGKDADVASSYRALIVVHQLGRLLEGGIGAGFYASVSKAAETYDDVFAVVDDVNDESIFSDGEMTRVLTAQAGDEVCTNADAARRRLTQWKSDRYHVFAVLAGALARGAALPAAELAKIPTDLPDPACPPGHPVTKQVQQLRKYAVVYKADVTLTSELDHVVLPALLVAMLVDYVRDGDKNALSAHIEDLSLRVLARVIAATDLDAKSCTSTGSCGPVDPPGPPVQVSLPASGNLPEELQALVEERFSPRSARRTCAYQAVAAALKRPVEIGVSGLCRDVTTGSVLDGSGPFAMLIQQVEDAPGIARWDTRLVHPIRTGQAMLSIASDFAKSVAYSNIVAVLDAAERTISKAPPLLDLSHVVRDSLHAFLDDRPDDSKRSMLAAAGSQLRPIVDDFLDAHLIPITCADGKDATSVRCGVRVLVGAVYEPLMTYIATTNPTDADRKRLATVAYKNALALDPLSRTPLLFNVGLGVTALTRFDGDFTGHLTLLDKFGLATRWGERNQWEAGFFAGGFLDAIVRASTGASDHLPYWLVGGTIGLRQIDSSWPFGLGIHLATALPFNLQRTRDAAALASGITLTVPADVAFGN